MGLYLFTWVCAYGKVPTVNPSVTAKATGGSPAVPSSLWQGSLLTFLFTHPYHLVVEVPVLSYSEYHTCFPSLGLASVFLQGQKIRENPQNRRFSLVFYMVLVHSVMRMPGISQMQ